MPSRLDDHLLKELWARLADSARKFKERHRLLPDGTMILRKKNVEAPKIQAQGRSPAQEHGKDV